MWRGGSHSSNNASWPARRPSKQSHLKHPCHLRSYVRLSCCCASLVHGAGHDIPYPLIIHKLTLLRHEGTCIANTTALPISPAQHASLAGAWLRPPQQARLAYGQAGPASEQLTVGLLCDLHTTPTHRAVLPLPSVDPAPARIGQVWEQVQGVPPSQCAAWYVSHCPFLLVCSPATVFAKPSLLLQPHAHGAG